MFTIRLGTEAEILSKHSQKLFVNGKRVGVSGDFRPNERSVQTIVTPNMFHRWNASGLQTAPCGRSSECTYSFYPGGKCVVSVFGFLADSI